MSQVDPTVLEALPARGATIPGAPTACQPTLREHDRLTWSVTDGGDPATLLVDFLTAHQLPVTDLTRPGRHHPTGTCGAALFLSAAASNHIAGASPGPPSPAPAVPDLVAIAYRHARPDEPPTDRTPPRHPTRWRLDPWRPSWTPARHAAAITAARTAISHGDVYQVNIVGHAAARYHGDPLPALTRVARLPGARYGGLLTGPGWAIACASPETLIEVNAGRATTRPIKGTRPATAAGRQELATSGKERAEHIMIVDLERNDLARIARTGTVRVDDLYTLRRWCDLWQAESTITAHLADGCGLATLLRAICPGGSVTGAPKLAALAQIATLEPVGRGPSMGALGWIGPDHVDLGLTIRTVAVDHRHAHLWAGGGITWGSDPTAEVAEAAAKAAPLRAALAGPTT